MGVALCVYAVSIKIRQRSAPQAHMAPLDPPHTTYSVPLFDTNSAKVHVSIIKTQFDSVSLEL